MIIGPGLLTFATIAITAVWVVLIVVCRLRSMKCDHCTTENCKERGKCVRKSCSLFSNTNNTEHKITLHRY